MDDIILQAEKLSKRYSSKKNKDELIILDDLQLSLPRSATVSVVGSSGSGKSTLLHILGGLERPDSGSVFWEGNDITQFSDEELAHSRNKNIGFVFQFHHLLPEFSALENTYMPLLIAGVDIEKAEERASSLLERFGIADRASHRPSELSGGEQQRVAVARAIINNPSVVLADEPTGNLDDKNTEMLLNVLFDLNSEQDLSLILVTHEMEVARRASTTYELIHGKLQKVKV